LREQPHIIGGPAKGCLPLCHLLRHRKCDHAELGRPPHAGGELVIHYLNPFVHVDANELVDLRNIGKLFLHDSNPDAPRKAAENALEAERALEDGYDLSQVVQYGMMVVMLVLGYGFGSQTSGSGINIGLMLLPW